MTKKPKPKPMTVEQVIESLNKVHNKQTIVYAADYSQTIPIVSVQEEIHDTFSKVLLNIEDIKDE